MCRLCSCIFFEHSFVSCADTKRPCLQTIVVFYDTVECIKCFFCLLCVFGVGKQSSKNCEDICKDVSFFCRQLFLVVLILSFCFYFIASRQITHTQHSFRKRQIELSERFFTYCTTRFSWLPANFTFKVLMFLVERSDFLHFFCCFILNENIKKFIFSNPGTANRFVVKPQVRHLIDFCFDRSQNILLKIRKYRILFSNSFFSAKFWFGITVAFALAFSLVSVDFIFRWHGKHPFEFFHVKHLEFVSL